MVGGEGGKQTRSIWVASLTSEIHSPRDSRINDEVHEVEILIDGVQCLTSSVRIEIGTLVQRGIPVVT